MAEEKILQLYNTIKSIRPNIVEFESFKSGLKDENKLRQTYDFLKSNRPNIIGYDDFKTNIINDLDIHQQTLKLLDTTISNLTKQILPKGLFSQFPTSKQKIIETEKIKDKTKIELPEEQQRQAELIKGAKETSIGGKFVESYQNISGKITSIPFQIVDKVLPKYLSDETLDNISTFTPFKILPIEAKRKIYNIVRGYETGLAKVGGSLLDPVNLGLMVSGSIIPATAGRILLGGFATSMALHLPEEWKNIQEQIKTGNLEEITDAIMQGIGTLGFTIGAGAGILKKGRKISGVKPEVPELKQQKQLQEIADLTKDLPPIEEVGKPAEIPSTITREAPGETRAGETAVITPEIPKAVDVLDAIYDRPKAKVNNIQMRKEFGDETIDGMFNQGLITKSADYNSPLTITKKGRELFGERPHDYKIRTKGNKEYVIGFIDITGKTWKPQFSIGKEKVSGEKYIAEVEVPINKWNRYKEKYNVSSEIPKAPEIAPKVIPKTYKEVQISPEEMKKYNAILPDNSEIVFITNKTRSEFGKRLELPKNKQFQATLKDTKTGFKQIGFGETKDIAIKDAISMLNEERKTKAPEIAPQEQVSPIGEPEIAPKVETPTGAGKEAWEMTRDELQTETSKGGGIFTDKQLENLDIIRSEIKGGQAGYRHFINYGQLDTGEERIIGVSSTFPEYFRNKGYTKKYFLNAHDKLKKGESLTQKQSGILTDLLTGFEKENTENAHRYIDDLRKKNEFDEAIKSIQEDKDNILDLDEKEKSDFIKDIENEKAELLKSEEEIRISELKNKNIINEAELNKGDKFTIKGEEFKVAERTDEGLKLVDDKTVILDDFQNIEIDKGSFEPASEIKGKSISELKEAPPQAEFTIPKNIEKDLRIANALFDIKDTITGETIKAGEPVYSHPELGQVSEHTFKDWLNKQQKSGELFGGEEFKIKEEQKGTGQTSIIGDLGSAISESAKAINEIVKDLPMGLSIKDVRKETGYKKAKPHFSKAWENYKNAGKGLGEFAEDMIKATGEYARPYAMKFKKEIEQETVNKLMRLTKLSKPILEEQDQLRHWELQKRVAIGKEFAQKSREAGELSSMQKSLGALKGEMPAEKLSTLQEWKESDIRILQDMIWDKIPEHKYFQRLNTEIALDNILLGKLPRRFEIALFKQVYGKKFYRHILSLFPKSERVLNTILEVGGISRAMLASFDISASFRQSMLLGIRHPLLWGKAFGRQIEALLSEKRAVDIDNAIKIDPLFELSQKAYRFEDRLYIAERLDPIELGKHEEQYASNFVKKIPFVKMSERAYITMLNKIRFDVWKKTASQWVAEGKSWKSHKQDFIELNRFINTFSGRGSLGSFSKFAPLTNATFFSPRLLVSRFQVPFKVLAKNSKVRNEAISSLLLFIGTGLSVLKLMSLNKGVEVETDPRSSDWGKGKIGNTRYDYWGGFQQIARFIVQLTTRTEKSTITKREYPIEWLTILSRFFQSKSSPLVGTSHDILAGEDFLGQPLQWKPEDWSNLQDWANTQEFKRFVPIFLQDLVSAANDEGWNKAFPVAIPSALGFGVQTHKLTDYSKLFLQKNQMAWQDYGKSWDNLTNFQQTFIKLKNPDLGKQEELLSLKPKGVPPLERQIKEDQKVGKEIQKKLDPNLQKFMRDNEISVGGIRRIILTDYYLNDERYEQYKNLLIETINNGYTTINKEFLNSLDEIDKSKTMKWFLDTMKDIARTQLIININKE